ncbi:hypothetical protein JX266_005728 [Neoarthrinium moseri]|uniref:uncharacterized protein n=1 Tax=Neoarthrinium moseri TaxID=1658444 RepID=UPI001FDE7DC7|nr:uncharacterized protein JN550_009514 [Neoarthrinium moseri]KAI1848422.1 hypothetical protein JX266_005728 [Neoarthrinium moseri]KAI1863403.1 hypothetical protein JN550_009514 [Neoarthrinium moseri]
MADTVRTRMRYPQRLLEDILPGTAYDLLPEDSQEKIYRDLYGTLEAKTIRSEQESVRTGEPYYMKWRPSIDEAMRAVFDSRFGDELAGLLTTEPGKHRHAESFTWAGDADVQALYAEVKTGVAARLQREPWAGTLDLDACVSKGAGHCTVAEIMDTCLIPPKTDGRTTRTRKYRRH